MPTTNLSERLVKATISYCKESDTSLPKMALKLVNGTEIEGVAHEIGKDFVCRTLFDGDNQDTTRHFISLHKVLSVKLRIT